MPVGYRSSNATGTADAQNAGQNCPAPAGVALNDIVILPIEVWLDTATDPIIGWPSGFTQKVYYKSTTDGFQRLILGWKRATVSEPATYNYTITNGSYWNMAHAIAMTGCVTTGDPFEFASTAQAAATTNIPSVNGTSVNIPGLVQVVANENSATQTPASGYTEVQDGNYLHLSYRLPGTTGLHTASGGTLSATNASILTALLALIPDDAAPPVDDGLWYARQSSGILIPQNSVFFPFTTPWAGQDVSAPPTASGLVLVVVRSTTATDGTRLAAGIGTTAQRSTTDGTGAKTSLGIATSVSRQQIAASGGKIAVGTAIGGGVRATTSCSGGKVGVSIAGSTQQSTTAASGRKTATGAGVDQIRSATAAVSQTGAASRSVQRSVTSAQGVRGASGAGTAATRPTTAAAGRKGGVLAGQSVCRTSSAGAGRKGGAAEGSSPARSNVQQTGFRRALSSGVTTCRTAAGSGGLRTASSAGQTLCRMAAASTGTSTPIPLRDVVLVATIESGRFGGTIAEGPTGSIEAGRWKGSATW